MSDSIETLKMHIEVLHEALKFYADSESHRHFQDDKGFMTNLIMKDRGNLARRALHILNQQGECPDKIASQAGMFLI